MQTIAWLLMTCKALLEHNLRKELTSSLASFSPSSGSTPLTSLMTLILAAASKPSSLTSNSVCSSFFSSAGAAAAKRKWSDSMKGSISKQHPSLHTSMTVSP